MKGLPSAVLVGVMAIAAYSPFSVYAASEPQLLITWSSQSYVPAWYQGKILPSANATVRASAQLLDNGKIVDMSKYQVLWRLNDHALASGAGTTATSFKASDQFASSYALEARIKKYQNGPDITSAVSIPRVQPLLSIDARYPNHTLPRQPVSLRALPFFFSITKLSDLNFNWKVNEQSSAGEAGDPSALTFVTEGNNPDATITTDVSAINIANPAEAAESNARFTLQ